MFPTNAVLEFHRFMRSHPVRQRVFPIQLSKIALLAVLAGIGWPRPLQAQTAMQPTAASAQGDAKAEEEAKEKEQQQRALFDLGQFRLRELRPTRNETAKITFALQLVLARDLDQRLLKQLEHWRHRLRDQVIIAIRTSERVDFLEPNLDKLQRRILLRVNRLLKKPYIEEVLFTEYVFATR